MEFIKKYAWYVPAAYIFIIYVLQGIQGLMGSSEYFELISVLGLPVIVTTALVYFVGPLDIGAGVLFFFRPRWYMFLYVGLWTWVPRTLQYFSGVEVEWKESLILSVAAVIAYLLYRWSTSTPEVPMNVS